MRRAQFERKVPQGLGVDRAFQCHLSLARTPLFVFLRSRVPRGSRRPGDRELFGLDIADRLDSLDRFLTESRAKITERLGALALRFERHE